MELEEWLGKDNQLGIDIWKNKYQFNNETLDEWFERVSGGNQELKQLIKEKKFLFGGRILANRGLDKLDENMKVTYSNCYVLSPPEDNIESIFECASKLARTYSYGGGCGIDLSKLSPKGARVHNAAKETSGAVSFMDLYSLVTGLIAQNGRRGALMISLSCKHPDLLDFIHIKSDLDKVTKANISIRITNEFMEAAKNHEKYMLSFIRPETGEKIQKEVDAYEVFMEFAKMNWDYAEPAMLFWDRISSWNLMSNNENFEYAGTNPCAEEPLPAGGSCLLGSLNLSEFVENASFDYGRFIYAVHTAVEALNDVLDEGLPLHPLQEQRDSVGKWRQIGLGVFGIADMLIKMRVAYGSSESLQICDDIASVLIAESLRKSALLAREKGAFEGCESNKILQSDFMKKNVTSSIADFIKKHGLRNSQLLTCAPTGSLSSMLGVSGGIEPIFANYYERKTESLKGHDEYYKVYTPIVKDYIEAHNLKDDTELPDYFVTASNLDYHDRIKMQAVWQQHIDASISSTVNLPKDTTVEQVADLYMEAWEAGLKGITVFRDGCKRVGILTTDTDKKDKEEATQNETKKRGYVVETSDNVIGRKRKLMTGCGSLHCTAFFDPDTGDLVETYLSKGSTGGCNQFMIGLSRMISLSARAGVSINKIIDQLQSCGSCPSYATRHAVKGDTSPGSCCPMAVGNALIEMYNEVQEELFGDKKVEVKVPVKKNNKKILKAIKDNKQQEVKNPCPQCGAELVFEGGCNICKNCGWTKCD